MNLARGVRLTRLRPAIVAAVVAADGELVHQRDELRAVAVLARGEDAGERAAPPVRDQVDLGGQAAPGPAQPLPARPGGRLLVIR